MIVLPKLYQHCKTDIKNALHHLHYGLGRYYKIQIYKGLDHQTWGDAFQSGDAVIFTIQQMSASIHLKANNDINQVIQWFNQTTQGVDIHVIDNKKHDLFVIALRNITKPKEVEVVKNTEGHVLEYVEKKEEEWTAIDATGLAEQPKQDDETV